MSRELPSQLFVKQNYQTPPTGMPQELSLGDIIGIVLDYKWLVIGLCLLGLLASFSYITTKPLTFNVDALIQSESDKKSIPLLTDVSEIFDTPTTGATEIELIKSRSNLAVAVQELHLDIKAAPITLPVIGDFLFKRHDSDELSTLPEQLRAIRWLQNLPLPEPSSFAWGGEAITVERFELELNEAATDWTITYTSPTAYSLYNDEQRMIGNGIVGEIFSLSDPDYGKVSLFVSKMLGRPGTRYSLSKIHPIQAIDALQANLEISERGKNTGVLQIGLATTNPVLGEQVVNLIATNYLRRTVEQKSQEAEQMLEFIQSNLPTLKASLDETELALEKHQAKHGVVDVTLEAQALIGGSADIEKQIALLQMEKAELTKRFTSNHPSLIALDEKLSGLRSRNGSLSAKLKRLPATELQAAKLSRDVKVASELYITLLNKAQELKIAKAGTVGSISIVDEAATNPMPVGTRPMQIIALGGLLGLALGVFLAIAFKRMRKGLSEATEIEDKTQVAVFASIPLSREQRKLNLSSWKSFSNKDKKILARVKPKDIAVEAIRSLRTSMQFARVGKDNKVIAISGPAPSLGKSFVSVNLAAVMADSGKKVLLIDADTRKGYLHHYFGRSRGPGLTELVTKQATLRDCVSKYEGNFHFLPSGSLPPNPSEILMSPRFVKFLNSARKVYDHIIIDTPPILAVTDPAIVAKYSDSVFLVLKADTHHEKEIKASIKPFAQAGANVTGLIVNMLPIEKQSKYGYRSQTYYHYSYK